MSKNSAKRAMQRLLLDKEELENHPVDNVSAVPLEDNMFEWHCNIKQDDVIYHLILFFPEDYPYSSPSAEFVPEGFMYNSGATMQGKKGTRICLSIFSDFSHLHTEWKDEKGLGWSPSYTVQTILMNVIAFLAETQGNDNGMVHNRKLSRSYACADCGHKYSSPYPAFREPTASIPSKQNENIPKIVDYISKQEFNVSKPPSQDNLYGYGLVVSGNRHRPSITTPCEFISRASFCGMRESTGQVHSVLKEELKYFLPLYIHPKHGEEIRNIFETTMQELASLLPNCIPHKTSVETMVLKTIPNLMNSTVVDFSKGTQYTSENSLNGYFALHRLLLWALEKYPGLQDEVEKRLEDFIKQEANRTKRSCPNVGEWLVFLTVSKNYRWEDAADAYLLESWRRNVMWYTKDDTKLADLDTPKEYRLEQTLKRTLVSRKLLAFQILFLDVAVPSGMTHNDLVKRYDDNFGFPTADMMKAMKEGVERIDQMKTYGDWFQILRLPSPPESEIFATLVETVKYASKTEGYFFSKPNPRFR